MAPPFLERCAYCHATQAPCKCAGCATAYCGEQCQRRDWDRGHAERCMRAPLAAPGDAPATVPWGRDVDRWLLELQSYDPQPGDAEDPPDQHVYRRSIWLAWEVVAALRDDGTEWELSASALVQVPDVEPPPNSNPQGPVQGSQDLTPYVAPGSFWRLQLWAHARHAPADRWLAVPVLTRALDPAADLHPDSSAGRRGKVLVVSSDGVDIVLFFTTRHQHEFLWGAQAVVSTELVERRYLAALLREASVRVTSVEMLLADPRSGRHSHLDSGDLERTTGTLEGDGALVLRTSSAHGRLASTVLMNEQDDLKVEIRYELRTPGGGFRITSTHVFDAMTAEDDGESTALLDYEGIALSGRPPPSGWTVRLRVPATTMQDHVASMLALQTPEKRRHALSVVGVRRTVMPIDSLSLGRTPENLPPGAIRDPRTFNRRPVVPPPRGRAPPGVLPRLRDL